MSEIELAKIHRNEQPIALEEWEGIIDTTPYLKPLPDREGKNPFNGEVIVFSGRGKALYMEHSEAVGNASLEDGEILVTGIPMSICNSIANRLRAIVENEDRS